MKLFTVLCAAATMASCGASAQPRRAASSASERGPRPDRERSTAPIVEQAASEAGADAERDPAADSEPVFLVEGQASYYSDRLAGRSTASGEPYRPARLTAAHRSLPFGTRLSCERLDNGLRVEVVVNDRGPFGGRGRVLDLSRRAAEQLDMIRAGVVDVRCARSNASPSRD